MKELLMTYALYNKGADKAMIEILKKIPEGLLKKDTGNYFKSIFETAMHLILMDIMWMNRTNSLLGNKYLCMNNSAVLKMSESDIREHLKSDYLYAFKLMGELDELLENYVNELDESDFNKLVKYKNIKGDETESIYWHTIFTIFNHGTHHRGAISSMLDQIDIENDFSRVQNYIK
jgi:uncharacterized damage-inducible protein DinB